MFVTCESVIKMSVNCLIYRVIQNDIYNIYVLLLHTLYILYNIYTVYMTYKLTLIASKNKLQLGNCTDIHALVGTLCAVECYMLFGSFFLC